MAGKETIENVQAVQLGARLARLDKVKGPLKIYMQYNLEQGWPGSQGKETIENVQAVQLEARLARIHKVASIGSKKNSIETIRSHYMLERIHILIGI